jgi:hypothetical protein
VIYFLAQLGFIMHRRGSYMEAFPANIAGRTSKNPQMLDEEIIESNVLHKSNNLRIIEPLITNTASETLAPQMCGPGMAYSIQ